MRFTQQSRLRNHHRVSTRTLGLEILQQRLLLAADSLEDGLAPCPAVYAPAGQSDSGIAGLDSTNGGLVFGPQEELVEQAGAIDAALQVIVPLYEYPLAPQIVLNPWWQKALDAASAENPLTIIANPASGPIAPGHRDYMDWINALKLMQQNPHLTIVGYVSTRISPTSGTVRDVNEILSFIHVYETHYKDPGTGDSLIDGVFLDEMSNEVSDVMTYEAVAAAVRSSDDLAGQFLVGNPGTAVPVEYLERNVADLFIIREGTPQQYFDNAVPGYVGDPLYDSFDFGAIIHTAPDRNTLNDVLRQAKLDELSYVFVTQDIILDRNNGPFDEIPDYFDELIQSVHAPFIESTLLTVIDGDPVGTTVGIPRAGDPDPLQSISYSIESGNRGNAFVIDPTTGEIRVNNSTMIDAVANPQFELTVGVTDTGDPVLSDSAVVNIDVLARPSIESVTINDGTAGRSQVTSVTLTFNTVVNHSQMTNAFRVTNVDTEQMVGTVLAESFDADFKTTLKLTFAGGSTDVRQGVGELSNSLSDGRYRLDVLAAAVVDRETQVEMGEDFTFGHDSNTNDGTDNFFRLFGDSDGDRDVDGQDYGRFGATFLTSAGSSVFNPAFDSDGDGDVDGQDYGRFGLRFLTSI